MNRPGLPSCAAFMVWAALMLGAMPAPAQPAPAQPEPAQPAPEQPAPEQGSPSPTAPAPDSTGQPLRSEIEEAQGTCSTPRQAWLQLLYWLQKGKNRWEPEQAARCLDIAQLSNPSREGPHRAVMLKELLDANSAHVDVDALPTNPDYQDNDTGRHVHWEPTVRRMLGRSIYLTRDEHTGQWLFSSETVALVPELYPVTGFFQQHMPPWANIRILGIEVWKFAALALLFFVARAVKWVAVLLLSRYLLRVVRRTRIAYLDRVVEHGNKPVGLLVMVVVLYLSLPLLLLPIRINLLALVVLKALAAYAGVWLCYRLIDVLTDFMVARAAKTESKLDDQLVPLVSKTLKVFATVVGGIFILQNLSINVSSLLAGLGLGGLAFALAAKDTVANFFGSVMIFVDKPFQIGDWVIINGTEGIIEEVGFRTSRVRTFYNSVVTVPNSMITSSMVDNYGERSYRRYMSNLGITYDTPPDKVQAFCEGIRAIIAGMPGMRKDYYMVEFREFGASSLVILVYCFMITDSWNQELRTRTNLNLEILRLAEHLGVSFAFPTQTLHVQSLPNLGESRPSHGGPANLDGMAQVVRQFGPGGSQARPTGLEVSGNYDCNAAPGPGSARDGN